MHFVKCTFSTKLTCNYSTKKPAVVPNVVLCVECSSLRPLSLWPCTWTLTVLLPPGKPCWCMWLCFIPTAVGCSELKLVQVWARRLRRPFTLWCSCLSDGHFAFFVLKSMFCSIMCCFLSLDDFWKYILCPQHWNRPTHSVQWCLLPSGGHLKHYCLNKQ